MSKILDFESFLNERREGASYTAEPFRVLRPQIEKALREIGPGKLTVNDDQESVGYEEERGADTIIVWGSPRRSGVDAINYRVRGGESDVSYEVKIFPSDKIRSKSHSFMDTVTVTGPDAKDVLFHEDLVVTDDIAGYVNGEYEKVSKR